MSGNGLAARDDHKYLLGNTRVTALQSTRVFKYRAVHFAIEYLRRQGLFGILPDRLCGHRTALYHFCAHFEYKDHRATQKNVIYLSV